MYRAFNFLAITFFALNSLAQSNTEFKPNVVASTQDANMQWWFNLPANSAPNVLFTKQVYHNQEFSLFSFFDKADIKNGNFDITYSIVSIQPDFQRKDIAENIGMKGRKPTKDIIVASTDSVGVKLDKSQAEGVYTFEIVATDKISNTTATNSTKILLSKWTAPKVLEGKKLVSDTIYNYYRNPSPELLYSVFFSPDLDLAQHNAPNGLNYIYVGFLKAAFNRNMFLVDDMLKDFKNLSSLNQSRVIFLYAILNKKEIDESLLSEAQIKYQNNVRNAEMLDSYKAWDNTLGTSQIDMLWGEFFADGTYKPIRRIMDLIPLVDEALFTKKHIQAKQKPTPDEMRKFMLGAYQMVALKSLLGYSKKFELVRKYCTWAIENKDIPESTYELLGSVKN